VPSQIFTGEAHYIPELDSAALIRELHVFGDQIPVGVKSDVSNPLEKGKIIDFEAPLIRGEGGFAKKIQHIPYNTDLTQKAQENRKNMNVPERKFWFDILKPSILSSYKFTKQKPLLDYIVDFYCAELALVIEIDGESHITQVEYDEQRTKKLELYGLRVLRYTNKEVMENTE
jgi:very-short-patch-repair endonuclease